MHQVFIGEAARPFILPQHTLMFDRLQQLVDDTVIGIHALQQWIREYTKPEAGAVITAAVTERIEEENRHWHHSHPEWAHSLLKVTMLVEVIAIQDKVAGPIEAAIVAGVAFTTDRCTHTLKIGFTMDEQMHIVSASEMQTPEEAAEYDSRMGEFIPFDDDDLDPPARPTLH